MKRKGLRIVRDKRPTKLIVHDANDVCKSGNAPSSMGSCVDEPRDRWMEYLGGNPNDNPNSINKYRIDDMYEAVDY